LQTGFLRQPTNEVAMVQRAGELRSESRLWAAWRAFRGHAVAASAAEATDESVSFAELVWAHHKRQQELEDDRLNGPWEQEYRRRLALFQRDHGAIVEAWWCRYEASGTALTEKRLRRRFRPDDRIFRLHASTDWRTSKAPRIGRALHDCETLAIRVSEILRDATEKVALHRLYATTSRLLAFVDKEKGATPAQKEMDRAMSANRAELRDIEGYYERAGENAARLVYFQGMAIGALFLGVPLLAAALVGWYADGLGVIDLHEPRIQYLTVCVTMGALGAIVSVMTRMASAGGFDTDFEVGRKPVRRLGLLRPFIGATFALALYIAVQSDLLEIGNVPKPGIYFFATVSFLAGFSERRAEVLLGSVAGGAGTPDARR
jgi:hypothetical protein